MHEIVLLPGLDGTGLLFERLRKRLEPAARVTVVSYPPDPAFTYGDYVDLAMAAIGSRRVVLLGESFSGPVAVMAAARLSKQIAGIVLSATFLRSPWPSLLVRMAAKLNPTSAPVGFRDAMLMGRFQDAELSRTLTEIVTGMPAGVRAARLRAVAGVDVRRDFSRLACPILALHGDADWLVPKSPLQVAVRGKPGAHMMILPGAHMLLQTRATAAAAEILAFIKATSQDPQ